SAACPTAEEVDARGRHHDLAALVQHFHQRADDAPVRLAAGGRRAGHGEPRGQRVARPHGLEPAELIDPGRAHARRVLEKAVVEEAHHHAPGHPPARDEPAVDAGLGRLLVRVEGLRIELAREGDHALLVHGAAAQLENLALLDVLPVAHPRAPPRSRPALVSYTPPAGLLIECGPDRSWSSPPDGPRGGR